MTDYENEKKAEQQAERIWPWVVFGVPAAFVAYALWVKIAAPIIAFLK